MNAYVDYDEYDDYDCDYEREPVDTEIVEKVYESGDESFCIEAEIYTYCIRKGTYSSMASDPDEYYGEYETDYCILTVSVYSEAHEDWVEMSETDLPDWVLGELDSDLG